MRRLSILSIVILSALVCGQAQKLDPTGFLPKGYIVFEKITGDLDKDGVDDCVLIIKGTDTNQIVSDEIRGKLDRNRRGIIVLLNKKGQYEPAIKNYDCFSSEHEDGGVYYPPDLSIEIRNGNLNVHYAHGRYGYWRYTFRFQNADLELIGYDHAKRSGFESDWVTFDETSINLLTKKKLKKRVIKLNADGKEVYKNTWKNISVNRSITLSAIKDFDEFDVYEIIEEK